MKYDLGKIYREVEVIFEEISFFEELPSEIQYTIQHYSDKSYDFSIDLTKDLDESNASKEALGIVVLLYLTYISKDKEEHEMIKNLILNN